MSATVRFNPDRQKWTVYVSRNGQRKSITCASEAEAKETAGRIIRTRDHQLGKVIRMVRNYGHIFWISLGIMIGELLEVFASK